MGEQLLMELVAATGLPQELVSSELNALIKKAGLDPARLSLEDIRLILAEYVQDVLLAAKTELASAANE